MAAAKDTLILSFSLVGRGDARILPGASSRVLSPLGERDRVRGDLGSTQPDLV
jgi:hypothetical protein